MKRLDKFTNVHLLPYACDTEINIFVRHHVRVKTMKGLVCTDLQIRQILQTFAGDSGCIMNGFENWLLSGSEIPECFSLFAILRLTH